MKIKERDTNNMHMQSKKNQINALYMKEIYENKNFQHAVNDIKKCNGRQNVGNGGKSSRFTDRSRENPSDVELRRRAASTLPAERSAASPPAGRADALLQEPRLVLSLLAARSCFL